MALFIGMALAAVSVTGIVARHASGAEQPPSDLPSDVSRYGFTPAERVNAVVLLEATRPFELALGNGVVRGIDEHPERLAKARAQIAHELNRYPTHFLEAIRLRGIVLCNALTEGNAPIPSLPNVGGLMLLDVDTSAHDLARALHHEIFHFADLATNRTLTDDPAWEALNASSVVKSFTYGGGGRSLRSSWAGKPSDLPGFVSAYATSGVEEDKAETFSFALTRADVLHDRIPRDPVLARKVAEVRRRVGHIDSDAPTRLGLDELDGVGSPD